MNLKERCKTYSEKADFKSFENQYLYDSLIEESFIESIDKVRKHSISMFGAPIIYSLKYSTKKNKGIRLVAEPGDLGMTVPEQINLCLGLLNNIAEKLTWDIAEDVNRIVSIIYPKEQSIVKNWLGGMWIGLDTYEEKPMLKLYMNLRHQTLQSRWQKIADVIVQYSSTDMEKVIRYIIEHTQQKGNPIGIGVGIGKKGIQGIRIYLSFEKPERDVWGSIYERFAPEGFAQVTQMIESYERWFLNLPQSVMTFDFVLGEGNLLISEPVRLKTELSGCNLLNQNQLQFEKFMEEQIEKIGFSTESLKEDISKAKECFSNIHYQYASYGSSTGIWNQKTKEHFTVYYEPVDLLC